MVKRTLIAAFLFAASAVTPALAQPKSAAEDEYYKILTLPIPDDLVLEVGGIEMMPDGKVAVATRRGDVYIIDNAFEDPPKKATFTRWATGLHEVLGLAWRD